jgi:hypothetical protein
VAGSSLLLGLIIFALLWFLNAPYRRIYLPRLDDITALADGLLLLPDAHWRDWFTNGHARFFDAYPEWPWGLSPFARPAFQVVIYLMHFILGKDWASYLAINYLGVAGIVAVAFAVARTAVGLGTVGSFLAAALVLLSPAVLEFSIWQLGFGSESFASLLVGCGFLALLARRDLLCILCLSVAVLTKETAVWAPVAAALTVLLQPQRGEELRRRVPVAAAMLLPLAMWLGLRIVFFGGVGGSYATLEYAPLASFLRLTGRKLLRLHHLFVTHDVSFTAGSLVAVDRGVEIGTALLLLLLLIPWALNGLRGGWLSIGRALFERGWPTADPTLLVTLWAVLGLAFYFVIGLAGPGYAASAVMFVWPAIVGEVTRRRNTVLQLGLAAFSMLSLAQMSHFLFEIVAPSDQAYMRLYFRDVAAMNAVIRQTPGEFRKIFVLSAGALASANPEHLRAFLGVTAEIVRVADIAWACAGPQDRVIIDHKEAGGVVSLRVTLPDCASLQFINSGDVDGALAGARILRSDSISYDLPDLRLIEQRNSRQPVLELGRRMTVHILPRGPARFIIERGGPDGGLAWFDVP